MAPEVVRLQLDWAAFARDCDEQSAVVQGSFKSCVVESS